MNSMLEEKGNQSNHRGLPRECYNAGVAPLEGEDTCGAGTLTVGFELLTMVISVQIQ